MMESDYDFALALQTEYDIEVAAEDNQLAETIHNSESTDHVIFSAGAKHTKFQNHEKNDVPKINTKAIVDQSWELVDPNPDIRMLFVEFNSMFFWGKLDSVEVRWSPRMTLCAGLCVYEGHGGLCSVRLSLPLLKLRPRKDLVETLLHEMIHAYLFVTQNNKDHDGHGPEFQKHMNRINTETGTGISIYHSFHDEVNLYRQHWWRCNGPCQKRPPYFGYVKRSMNRAPAPRDTWWAVHQKSCGGTYTKIKEPENYGKKKQGDSNKNAKGSVSKKVEKPKSKDNNNMDIRQFTKSGNNLSSTNDKNSEPKPSSSKDYEVSDIDLPSFEVKERDPNWRPRKSKSARPLSDSDSDTEMPPKQSNIIKDVTENVDVVTKPGYVSKPVTETESKPEEANELAVNRVHGNIHGFRKSDNAGPVITITAFSGRGNVLGSTSPSNLSRNSSLLKRLKLLRDKSDQEKRDEKMDNIKSISNNSSIQNKRQSSSPPYGDTDRLKKQRTVPNNQSVAPIPITVGGVTGGDPNVVEIVGPCGGLNVQDKVVACPVCQKQISEAVINEHLDLCLMGCS